MASDADWVEDVRRWYYTGRRRADDTPAVPAMSIDEDALGYEAAYPPLQAAAWPDAPVGGAAVTRTAS